jgi:hypothetical protein
VGSDRFDSTDYRRCARRLRHLHRTNPARLARSLRDLSLAYDARVSEAPDAAHPAAQFAQRVVSELEGNTLRYSSRVRLLHEAQQRGIRRFDANLIIASVQERVQGLGFRVRKRTPRRTWQVCAAAFFVIQGLIFAGATYVFAS